MIYPEHLLPKPNYCIIQWRNELCEHYLLRTAPTADVVDTETGMVRVLFVNDNSREQLIDYSTSLAGGFKTSDAAIEWNKNGRKTYFTEAWTEGKAVDIPTKEDFIVREHFGCFYYSIQTIHHYPQPIDIQRITQHTKANCFVCHTPKNGNFWHYSVRWKIGQNDIEQQMNKKERRDLLGLVRTFLTEHALLVLPPGAPNTIPEKWYVRNDSPSPTAPSPT
jgi:hypothetical protein